MPVSGTKEIQVVVNGEPRSVPGGLNLAALLAWLNIDSSRVAVEVNRSIVRKTEWKDTSIGEGAALEIVQFVGGG